MMTAYIYIFTQKIRLDICHLFAKKTLHMICQVLVSLKDYNKY